MSADHRVQHQYDQNNVAEEPSPLASSDTTTDDTNRRGWYVPKKWKVMVALMLLIALMGVLMIVIIVTATRGTVVMQQVLKKIKPRYCDQLLLAYILIKFQNLGKGEQMNFICL